MTDEALLAAWRAGVAPWRHVGHREHGSPVRVWAACLVVLAACGGPAAAPPAGAGNQAPAMDARLVELLAATARLVASLETVKGDCDGTVRAIEAFAASADGATLRRAADDEMAQLAAAHRDDMGAAASTIAPRFAAALAACTDQPRILEALGASGLFIKRRVE